MTNPTAPIATPIATVILAAGKGTRMRSGIPKVLHRVAHAPLLHHAMASAAALGPARTVVVVGHAGEAVAESARARDPQVAVAVQAEQRGTGDAVLSARQALAGFEGDLFVLYADVPFVGAETLRAMAAARATADLVVLGFEAADPGRYGRLVLEGERLTRIVEAADAAPAELAIPFCNSGLMAGDAATLLRLLERCRPDNAQGEIYLTDVVGLAHAEGLATRVVLCPEAETQGVNDRVQLAAAEAAFQTLARAGAMGGGATLTAPETVFLAFDTVLGRDVEIEPHVVFGPGVTVGDGARIRAFCHLEDTRVGPGAHVGPFARARGGSVLGAGAKLGNFVEVKNARLGEGVAAAHLSYLGDATVGARANIGAGTITCNYDGVAKHHTRIGEGAFIGTNTALVAPVHIGEGAYVATGTVVTRDVEPDSLAIARTPQTNRPGYAARLRDLFRRRKAGKATGGA